MARSCSFFNILLEWIMVSTNINTANIILNNSILGDHMTMWSNSSCVWNILRKHGFYGDKQKYMLFTPKHTEIELIITMCSYNKKRNRKFVPVLKYSPQQLFQNSKKSTFLKILKYHNSIFNKLLK